MSQIAVIGILGALGALLRFALAETFDKKQFPYGTLIANLLACLLVAILGKCNLSGEWALIIYAGFVAALSTFSSLAWQIAQMLQNKKYLKALVYMGLSCIGILIIYFAN